MNSSFTFNDVPEIESSFKEGLSIELEGLCRFLYEAVYKGIQIVDGQYAMFIPNDILEEFGQKSKELSEKISIDTSRTTDEIFIQLLSFVHDNYTKTATRKEYDSMHHMDNSKASGMFYGTRYNFNEIPNWDEFVERVVKLMS